MTEFVNFVVGNDTSYQNAYQPVDLVASFHGLPRFSHHNDFSALFSSEREQVTEYTSGLLFVACIIMSFFTVWGLLLLLFKCLGPDNCGILSGYPYEREGSVSRMGRITFLFSALMVMIFTTLAITQGFTKLQDSSDTVDATNHDAIKIHNELLALKESLVSISRQAVPIRDELADFLNGDVCPLIPLQSGGGDDIRSHARGTWNALHELTNFISDDLGRIQRALGEMAITTRTLDNIVQQVQFTSGAIVGITIPYFIIPALLIVTLIMGWTETYIEEYYCFTTWFTLPMFILMVIFSYVACGFSALATESNADFCSGGTSKTPEGTIDNIMGNYNLTEGDLYYDAIKFYSHQCTVDGPWGFLEDYIGNLSRANSTLSAMGNAIDHATPEYISQACGVDYDVILQLIRQLTAHTMILTDATERSLELLSCKTIVPLYTSSVYDATCQNNMTAATWVFSCALIISFFGMLMITLRGSYYPFFIWEGKDDEYSTENSDMLGLEEDVSDERSQNEDSEYIDASQMGSDLYLEEAATEDDQNDPEDGELAAYGDGASTMEESHFEEESPAPVIPTGRRRKN